MGLFIVFEGGEGAGKTTQARKLYGNLCKEKYPARLLHEPGDTPLGNALRTLVTAPRDLLFSRWRNSLAHALDSSQLVAKDIFLPLTPEAELFLFAAARAQLVTERLKPFLQRNLVVICDRYKYSTMAYQGYGHGMDLNFIDKINDIVGQGIEADLVILLDIEPSKGLNRKRVSEEISKFEVQEFAFHQRVRQGYLEMAQHDPQRWAVIDGSLPKKDIERLVRERLEYLLPRLERPGKKVAKV